MARLFTIGAALTVFCGATAAQLELVREFAVPSTDARVRILSSQDRMTSVVSRDGGRSWVAMPDIDTTVRVRDLHFDPLTDEPALPAMLMAQHDNELYLVQFHTDVLPTYLGALQELGAEPRWYLPNQTYVVRMTADSRRALADAPYVRATVDYHPAYRLDPAIATGLSITKPV